MPKTETMFIAQQIEKTGAAAEQPRTFSDLANAACGSAVFKEDTDQGKILIVDDERFNCDIIEGFLMVLGMKHSTSRVEACYNGEQAVRAIQNAVDEHEPYKFTLILMDCNMPFLDGYEATKQIRKIWLNMGIKREFQPKIIAVTGHVEAEYVLKAINSGMDKVYPKPLPIKEFGKLLMDMKFINEVPEHLRVDTNSD